MEGKKAVRVLKANRNQVEMRAVDLDSLLPADHRARVVWAYVEQLDLAPLYERIKAVEGHAGRPSIDPAILLALWLYATLEGVGSARALDRLCNEHEAYRWICGGVGVNHHTLADFRVEQVDELDRLLTEGVAALMTSGAVSMERVAQDGMRVRASAGAPSFRRRTTLQRCLAEAESQVRQLREEVDADPAASSRRQQVARERAARERTEQVEQALSELSKIEAQREHSKSKSAKTQNKRDSDTGGSGGAQQDADKLEKQDKKRAPRASTTDPEARVMKGPDGGFRPSYNVQFATDTATGLVVGADVSNRGSDAGQLSPMLARLHERYGRAPAEALVDNGFASHEEIDAAAAMGTRVYAPVPEPKNPQRDPHVPLRDDSPAVAAWRMRMGSEEARRIYKQRPASAEWINAQAHNRGLRQFLVRGLAKVRAVALWQALAHNLMVQARLTAAAG